MDNLNQDEVAFFYMLAMCLLLRWQSSVTSSVTFSQIKWNNIEQSKCVYQWQLSRKALFYFPFNDEFDNVL